MPGQATGQVNQHMQQCIDECLNCHRICLEMVNYCLQQGGQHAAARHITTLLACAEICQTSANFMILGTELHRFTCGACAQICEQCATECERMGNDAQMKACAEACRRCAESCRRMANV